MFDNVLLPIDITHPASWEKALPMAARLVGASGTVHLLGIVHDLGAAMVASYLPPDFEQKALGRMKDDLVALRAANLPDGPACDVHVGHGHVPETILRVARTLGADAIVMASHAPDDLRHLLVGSYAEKVVRHADVPVMIVR